MFDDLKGKGKLRLSNPTRPLPDPPSMAASVSPEPSGPPAYEVATNSKRSSASSSSSSVHPDIRVPQTTEYLPKGTLAQSSSKRSPVPDQPPHMGSITSDLAQQPASVPAASVSITTTTRAWVHLHRGDRIGFHGFPNFIVQQIYDALPRFWMKGLRTKTTHGNGVTEFFLIGAPFHGHKPFPHPPRDLVLFILSHLSKRGYHLETSLACSRLGRALDQDTLFFKQGPPRDRKWCYVMMHWTDRVRLVGWEDPAVLAAFQAAMATWPLGIQATAFKADNIFQAKLKGTPWYILDSPQIASARDLLARLLDEMEAIGYELVGTVEATMGIGAVDPRTLYFASKASTWPTD